jgi:hypothetical protein
MIGGIARAIIINENAVENPAILMDLLAEAGRTIRDHVRE